MAAMDPMIFVVGSAGVGKKSLVSRITGSPDQNVPCTWRIDTRYYVADTIMRIEKCSDAHVATGSVPYCEALILVVDAAREETFQEVSRWLSHQDFEAEINLVVFNKADKLKGEDGTMQREAWHTAARDWCCERLFEFIEVCPTKCLMC
jgi:putative ribosome biogenesis GTPase RsgA